MLQNIVDQLPTGSAGGNSLSRALSLMRRVLDEGRDTLHELRSPETTETRLEQQLAELGDQLASQETQFRISIMGRPQPLHSAVQEQVFLIVREALLNAFRHSGRPLSKPNLSICHTACGLSYGMMASESTDRRSLRGGAPSAACSACAKPPRASLRNSGYGAGGERARKLRYSYRTRQTPRALAEPASHHLTGTAFPVSARLEGAAPGAAIRFASAGALQGHWFIQPARHRRNQITPKVILFHE